MKFTFTFLILFLSTSIFSQTSEDFIPKDAVSVFSINNVNLLQKISMDDLVQYEFMEELQQELFDGSTNGKTLKDAGIDFNQKMNIYYGKGKNYEVSGFSFGISDKNALFLVFDDFDRQESPYPGVEFYSSYFNQLLIYGNVGILLRVDPNFDKLQELADSTWYAQGHTNPWYWNDDYDNYDYEGEYEGDYDEDYEMEEEYPAEEFEEGETIDEIREDEFDVDELPIAEDNPGEKNYQEIQDSISYSLRLLYLDQICKELFVDKISLKTTDSRFANQLTHNTEGTFYLDNSRNFRKDQGLYYFQSMLPSLFGRMEELYTGNVMLGDISLKNNSIDLNLKANYSEALGSIYKELADAKFDKNIVNYIPANSSAYFTYTINLREAYEQALEIILPILEKEENPRVAQSVLMIELMDEFINKDALFDTYKGSMFGSYNGVKSVEVERIVFSYDEETFDYTEETVISMEDIPVFTMGFSTGRPDIPEKILDYLKKITRKITQEGDVWKIDKGFLDAIPLYIINKNGLFIITNDEQMVRKNSEGFGSDAISKKKFKKAKSGGVMYAYVDLNKTLTTIPQKLFSDEQAFALQKLKDGAGAFELTSSKTTSTYTNFDLKYQFENESDNVGKYILDMINSLYILTKQ